MPCQDSKTFQRRAALDLTETQERVQTATHIFREYGPDIREMIRFSVRDDGVAEDIYQDLFLSLASSKLPPKIRNMRRFLYRAITNDIISMVRRSRRRHELMKLYARDYRAVESEETSPGELLIQSERKEQVFSQLEKELCPSEYRAVLWRFQRGGDNEAAAEELGIKKRSFIRYLCAGLKKIRRLDWSEEGVSG
ncbi:MAG: sigma-70 family RNA polymerase sigma factor [Phycisphaeraceae bacterium]|nr:sigma-70 family RNA polymerase sigma factor [Phycisphaeraceae bacterium]